MEPEYAASSGIELTPNVDPLKKHAKLLSTVGLDLGTMKCVSEQTLYTALKDAGGG